LTKFVFALDNRYVWFPAAKPNTISTTINRPRFDLEPVDLIFKLTPQILILQYLIAQRYKGRWLWFPLVSFKKFRFRIQRIAQDM